ncbi:MAG: serine/threonine-protein kinase [Pirellulales bacterium]
MSIDQEHVRAIFNRAIEQHTPQQWQSFLDGACGDDVELRRRVERLLHAHQGDDSFLDRGEPVDAASADAEEGAKATAAYGEASERVGAQIGPYKLLQQIGEGGMGVVYLAEQIEPVRRKVALKVIKPGMDTRQVIARFEAERQALAVMDHQNIARVLDAGATPSGRPFFVMELVHGVPLTRFCDESRLTPRERLELFIPVCQAIQHAHQKGVIHRDIKPSNILVTMYDDKPVPKVIDFGVAKAIEQRLTEKTLFTQYGSLVGTFEYMSPEQAEMNALGVDTRSDIYSLGVLLYELLTGTTPLERSKLQQAALIELVRLIKEDEPPRPSIRLGSTSTSPKFAAACRTEPTRLSQFLRGELDWIVMKCLEKDRSRRYETASGLARDVQRFLSDEPVEACPPSAVYRTRKFLRKHRAGALTTAMVVMTMLVGTLASYWQAYRAAHAEQRAVIESQISRQAREAEATQRQRAEANERAARVSEQTAQQQRDAAKAAQAVADQEKNGALAAKEELRQTLYAAEMNLVQVAWDGKQYERVRQLLEEQPTDLRGFEWRYWRRRLQNGLEKVLPMPDFAPNEFSRSFSASLACGGRRVAAVLRHPDDGAQAYRFGRVVVLDAATGKNLFEPIDPFPDWTDDGYTDRLLAISEDGSRLAVAVFRGIYRPGDEPDGSPNAIGIYDGNTGRLLHELRAPGSIYGMSLLADGSRLAVVYLQDRAGRAGGMDVWDASTGRLLHTLDKWERGFTNFSWSPDGRLVFRRASSQNAAPVVLEGIEARVPDDYEFEVVEVESGKQLWRRSVRSQATRPSNDDPLALRPWTWSPNGKWIVVAQRRTDHAKANLQFWDSRSGEVLAVFDRDDEAVIDERTIRFSDDGRSMALSTASNEIYIWHLPDIAPLANGQPLHVPKPHATLRYEGNSIVAVAFSADGQTIYSAAKHALVHWRAHASDDVVFGPSPDTGVLRLSASRRVAISPDGTKVVMNGRTTGRLHIWDLTSDREMAAIEQEQNRFWESPVFSPDSRHILLRTRGNSDAGGVRLTTYDALTGAADEVIPVDHDGNTGLDVCYRPDGRHIAALVNVQATTPRKQLLVWDRAAKTPLFSVPVAADEQLVPRLRGYTANGESLIVAFLDRANTRVGRKLTAKGTTIAFFNAESGESQRSMAIPDRLLPLHWAAEVGAMVCVTYPDFRAGERDARYGAEDIVVLDLTTGRERIRLRGHRGFDLLAASPDGRRLVLGKGENANHGESEITIWSLESGRPLATFVRSGILEALSFSRDGNRLIAVFANDVRAANKPIQVWDAAPLPEA